VSTLTIVDTDILIDAAQVREVPLVIMKVMRKQTKVLGGRMKLKLMVGVCSGILPRKFEKIETRWRRAGGNEANSINETCPRASA
jgi:hypothetical protein